jgi:cytochrome c553
MRLVVGRASLVLVLSGLLALHFGQSILGQSQSLEQNARALLEAKCFACHGDVRTSGLDMRQPETLLKGGSRGPAVVPGRAEESLLYRAVRRDGELQMPPGRESLTGSEVALLRDWINAGARWDTTAESRTAATPSWWSFKKPVRPAVPHFKGTERARNPIDAFILARLEENNLHPAPPAGRRTLIRRAFFDLHGLPPTPQQVEEFVSDKSPDAYEKLIDRLLESPRYGERWGRYWLDLVRYADTSGFETDHFYVNAWRYRDYVIESFNNDKAYDIFIKEQIAADEIWSTNMDLEGTLRLPEEKEINVRRRIGTSLFTLGAFPIEYTYYGDQYRAEWAADAVDTVGAAFLGLTVACARCHDHKFDPISQREYYRMTALFYGSVERELPLVSLFDIQTNTRNFPLLNQARILKQMARRGGGTRENDEGDEKEKAAAAEQDKDNTTKDSPRARAAKENTGDDVNRGASTHAGSQDSERAAMLQKVGEAYLRAPERYPTANVLGHEEVIPQAHILIKGEFKNKGEKVEPGVLSALNPPPPINEPKDVLFVPRRRKALALWLTSPEQPLVSRVMVNRIWQGHFGQGLVRTPNDFGRQGDPPTHPELLEWLAVEFMERGWSMKQMHRLILLSNTYQQSSVADGENLEKDPDNHFLGRMNRRRLDADAIRDSILAVAGVLNLKMGGVGVIPPLTREEILAARMPQLWPANPDPAEHRRRSIYLQMKRSFTLPMLQIFDAPDTSASCPRRETSTVAPQALALMNSEFSSEQARHFADYVREQAGDAPPDDVEAAWKIAFGRPPTLEERQTALDYLQRNSLERLCLLMFNMNQFLYID